MMKWWWLRASSTQTYNRLMPVDSQQSVEAGRIRDGEGQGVQCTPAADGGVGYSKETQVETRLKMEQSRGAGGDDGGGVGAAHGEGQGVQHDGDQHHRIELRPEHQLDQRLPHRVVLRPHKALTRVARATQRRQGA